MADRRIEDLPSVSNVTDSIQFPVSQDGTAMRISVGDLESKFTSFTLVSVTGNTASMTASEIYDAIVNNQKNVVAIFPDGQNAASYGVFKIEYVEKNGNDYTAFFYAEKPLGNKTEYAIDNSGNVTATENYDVTAPSKSALYAGTSRLSLNYTPSNNLHAVNKAYVDDTVASSIAASNNVVFLVMDENNKVFNGSSSITGSQINSLLGQKKAVFLFDTDNERFYQYLEPAGSGAAVFSHSLDSGKGVFTLTVAAMTNDAEFHQRISIPSVSINDNGKVLGVVNGAWAATGRILPAVTADNNGMVLGVVNGNWTLVDPSSFNE